MTRNKILVADRDIILEGTGYILEKGDKFRVIEKNKKINESLDPELEQIEMLIDSLGLPKFFDQIVEVCYLKAEHLRSAWQDEGQAKLWERNASIIESASSKIVIY